MIPNLGMKRVINEILKLQRELHIALREKALNSNSTRNDPELSKTLQYHCDSLTEQIGSIIFINRIIEGKLI